jgi:preprotein translocase subunit SecE
VARQTRSERRARRAAQAESRASVERAPADAKPASDGHPSSGRRGGRFISESWAELQKVDWPGQQQLIQGTVVVLIACLVTGVYLFAADELFRRLVQHVLLR